MSMIYELATFSTKPHFYVAHKSLHYGFSTWLLLQL